MYKDIASEHLEMHKTILDVAAVGFNENGDEIFGIRMICQDGSEEWYDKNSGNPDVLVGWDSQDEAYYVLENKVLPNIGYTVHQQALLLFYKNM